MSGAEAAPTGPPTLPQISRSVTSEGLQRILCHYANRPSGTGHVAKELNISKNIRLLPEPPHSPELDPVEHTWEDLKEKAIPNTDTFSSE